MDMALCKGLRQSRCISSFTRETNTTSLQLSPKHFNILSSRFYHHQYNNGNQDENGSGPKVDWRSVLKLGTVAGITAIAFTNSRYRNGVLAKESVAENLSEEEIIEREMRVRQYSRIETMFDYFSTYQIKNKTGAAEVIMSVKDFYNAITPGSHLTHGVGRGSYTLLKEEDIHSVKLYEDEKIPDEKIRAHAPSVLNAIQKHGMLTFQDFCFLMNLIATPRRYMDICFHSFDISASGVIEPKEFVHVLASTTKYKGDPNHWLDEDDFSGLITYLFGKDRKNVVTKDQFFKLRNDLLEDIFWLEFTQYSKDGKTMSDEDFCNHLFLTAKFSAKKKNNMIQRLKRQVRSKEGITYDEFKNFHMVLIGGSDLERALFFLGLEKNKGINSQQFLNIANWVANCELESHIVEVLYALLDDNEDGLLSYKEFAPVLFGWRKSRGFEHKSIQIALKNIWV